LLNANAFIPKMKQTPQMNKFNSSRLKSFTFLFDWLEKN